MSRNYNQEERYKFNIRKQQKTLEEFAAHEIDRANDLMLWHSVSKRDMPDDAYRACAFFLNREFYGKPGSLTLLYEIYQRCNKELPKATKEIALDLLTFQFKMYANALEKGGF